MHIDLKRATNGCQQRPPALQNTTLSAHICSFHRTTRVVMMLQVVQVSVEYLEQRATTPGLFGIGEEKGTAIITTFEDEEDRVRSPFRCVNCLRPIQKSKVAIAINTPGNPKA